MPRQYTPRLDLDCSACGKSFRRRPSGARSKNIYCQRACQPSKPAVPAEVSADGLTARLPLFRRDGTVRAYAKIDANDATWVSQWRWHMVSGYAARAAGKGWTIYLHCALLDLDRESTMAGSPGALLPAPGAAGLEPPPCVLAEYVLMLNCSLMALGCLCSTDIGVQGVMLGEVATVFAVCIAGINVLERRWALRAGS